MAEEKAPAAPAPVAESAPAASKKQPVLLMGLVVLNMVVVAGVGVMIWQNRKKEEQRATIEKVVEGEHQTQQAEKANENENAFVGKNIPLETFIINLAGSKGRRVAKVNIELEVEGQNVAVEIEQRKAQIRDIIIILLSGKTYDQVANKEGKDQLREEVKDTVNAFLTKGKIKSVYFTDFIYN